MKFNKELLKGTTDMIVLKLLSQQDMYGYEIMKKLKQKTDNIFELREGTLYPILHNLESKKLITSYCQPTESQRKKIYYKITEKGRKILQEKEVEWKNFSEGISKLMGGIAYES